jgi:signal transduction histidine kinase
MRDDGAVRLRLVVAGAAVVALGGLSLSIAGGGPGLSFAATTAGSAALLIAGWSLAAAGLLVGATRPGNRTGPLLLLTSATWLLGEWDDPYSGSSATFTIGLVLFASAVPLVGWLTLAYPAGRLSSAATRTAIVVGFLASVVLLGLLPTLFFDPQAEFCSQCAENLASLRADPARSDALTEIGFRVSAVVSLATIGLAAWRLGRSSRAQRRVCAPVVVAGSVYLAAFAWTSIRSVERGFLGSGDVERRLWFVEAVALTLMALAVMWNRVQARRTRASLTRLVVELAEASEGGLKTLLARTLDDDTLEIAYPVGANRFADATGAAIDLPPRDGRAASPIVRDGETAAVVLHRPGLLDDAELVEEVAMAARLALDNERLQAELRIREAELNASRARVVAASDAERRRLERDLHDGAQQRLIGLLIGARTARRIVAVTDGDARCFDEAIFHLQHAVDALRDIAHGLHPAALTDEGLAAAFDALAERSPSPVCVVGVPEERLPPIIEHAAYRIVAEAAKVGPVRAVASRQRDVLVIDIDSVAVPDPLVELQDRVGAIGGQLDVTATDVASVHIHAALPCGVTACG